MILEQMKKLKYSIIKDDTVAIITVFHCYNILTNYILHECSFDCKERFILEIDSTII